MFKKLNVNCPVGKTGYGITSLNITKTLSENFNVNVSLFPIGNNMELNNDKEKELFTQLLKNNHFFDKNAPCLKIWHQHDLSLRIGKGHFYTFPFFEIDTLNSLERHHLNSCDYIFTASKWSKEILINNDIKVPIYVAPLGVDMEVFASPAKIKMDNGNYIFSHVGKWEHRKSHDFLLSAFEKAFDVNDNVELWLLPHNMFLNEQEENQWLALVENNNLKDKIKIFNRLPTQYHLAEFIYYSDCGVFLSRAEGWNNEILEFMALNKPVITTNYSAHTEYCDTNNSYLVDIKELEIANDGKWFFGQGKWAKLGDNEMEQTVLHMRNVYNNNIKDNPSGLETAKKYSWNNTSNIIDQTLLRNNSYHANTQTRKKRKR